MRIVFIIYWLLYPALEYLKRLNVVELGVSVPLWVAVNLEAMIWGVFLMLPSLSLAMVYTERRCLSFKWLFYCMASFYCRIFTFIMGIEFGGPDNSIFMFYGVAIMVALLLEKPFKRKMERDFVKDCWYNQ